MRTNFRHNKTNASWQPVGKWYQETVGLTGHYYHKHIIIPGVLKLLALENNSSLLDIACGQGVLARYIPPQTFYQGIDAANSLIAFAREHEKQKNHLFTVADVTEQLPITKKDFTHATIILALQNIDNPVAVFSHLKNHLVKGAKLVIVLNHPCFRIPRQSSWGIDEQNKLQYRRINRYLSPLKIPIKTNPGQGLKSPLVWSFHLPISSYSEFLYRQGFHISKIEEWVSDKASVGSVARMENRGRSEIPLFMAILAVNMAAI